MGIFSFSENVYISESGSGIYLIINERMNPSIGASSRVRKTYCRLAILLLRSLLR